MWFKLLPIQRHVPPYGAAPVSAPFTVEPLAAGAPCGQLAEVKKPDGLRFDPARVSPGLIRSEQAAHIYDPTAPTARPAVADPTCAVVGVGVNAATA